MRKYFPTIFLIMGASILMSCKAAPEPQTAGTDAPTPAAQKFAVGELSWIFDEPPNPVDVAVMLESSGTVQALIPIEGGSITATGADGTTYSLEIPSDALLKETLIGLTPVSSIAEMPFGSGQTYAVQLSPDGLVLQNFAVLTITPTAGIPLDEQLVFGYQEQGSDVILAAPVVDSNEIKINVLHFSGNGVTRGFWADVESERQRLGGNIERQLENVMNQELIRIRQEGRQGNGESLNALFRDTFRQYVELVIKPRVAAAGESCAAGRLALETVNSFRHQAAVLGFDPDDFLAGVDLGALLEKAMRVCVIEEFELCVEQHIIYRMISVPDEVARHYALLGIPEGAALREARDLATKCLTFRLMFESTGKMDAPEGGFRSSVTSELILRYQPDQGFIVGAVAGLINTDFEFFTSICSVTSTPGNGDFAVLGMSYEMEEPDAQGYISDIGIRDIKLVYMPGNTTESFKASCPAGGSIPISGVPLWTSSYMDTHFAELEGGSFVATGWEMLGGELFARKEWSLAGKDSGVSEQGSFTLYHAPGE